MSVSLTQLAEREASAERNAQRRIMDGSGYLTGTGLARECAGTVRYGCRALHLSEGEREALAQDLALWAIQRHGGRVPRGAIGRSLLASRLATLLRDSRGWRDCASSWDATARAGREGGYVIVSADALEGDSDALEIARERERSHDDRAPLPSDVRDLAAAVVASAVSEADALERSLLTPAECRRLLAALLAAWQVPLDAIAREQRRTVNAVTLDASRGRKVLRALWPEPDQLRDHVRAVAAAMPVDGQDWPFVVAWIMGRAPERSRPVARPEDRHADGREHPCKGGTARDVLRYMGAVEAAHDAKRERAIERAMRAVAARLPRVGDAEDLRGDYGPPSAFERLTGSVPARP